MHEVKDTNQPILKTKYIFIYIDVDGVLTDNKVYYDQNGNELVSFNRKDGFAISVLKTLGHKVIFITREKSNIKYVKRRASKLKVEVVQTTNKAEHILCQEHEPDEVVFITDAISDLNDVKKLKDAGIKYILCPEDSDQLIKKESYYVIPETGGNGVVNRFYIDFFHGRSWLQ